MSASTANAKRALAKLKKIATNEQSGGRPMIENTRFRERMAEVETEIMALEYSTLRFIAAAAKGEHPGSEASLLKLRGSQVRQRLSELTMEAVGHYAFPHMPEVLSEGWNEPPHRPGLRGAAGGNLLQRPEGLDLQWLQ